MSSAVELICSNDRCQAVYPYDGTMVGAYCTTCWRGQLLIPSLRHRGHRVRVEDSDRPADVRSAVDLLMDRHSRRGIPATLARVVGDDHATGPETLRVGLEGPPSGGKTHLALEVIRDLCADGRRVLMVSAEMGTGAVLADRLAQMEGPWSGLDVTDTTNIYRIAQRSADYDWVVADSMAMIDATPAWWMQHIVASSVLIFQVTKGGVYRGDQGWQHLCDLWVRCYHDDEYRREVTKCWLAATQRSEK